MGVDKVKKMGVEIGRIFCNLCMVVYKGGGVERSNNRMMV